MPQAIRIVGKKFNRLTVISEAGRLRGLVTWRCLCDCGNHTVTTGVALRKGRTKSCGCFKLEILLRRSTKHGDSLSSGCHSLYYVWANMIQRCENPKRQDYRFYGARGISVCDRWRTYALFREDVEPTYHRGLKLDRFPNKTGNYEPGNFRWATQQQQCRNQISNRMVTHDGITLNVSEWAERTGIRASVIYKRFKRGWCVHDALTTPTSIR